MRALAGACCRRAASWWRPVLACTRARPLCCGGATASRSLRALAPSARPLARRRGGVAAARRPARALVRATASGGRVLGRSPASGGAVLNPRDAAVAGSATGLSNKCYKEGMGRMDVSHGPCQHNVFSMDRYAGAPILRECPNKLLVTTEQCVFSMLQAFIVAVVVERDFSRWKLRFDVSLLAILYSVRFVVMEVASYLQAWCVEMKGPVFLSVWTPLCFVFTMFCSSFFLGENVHLGSIVGAILLVAGLYSMLWGKTKENNSDRSEQDGQHQQEKYSEIEKGNGKDEQMQRMASKESASTTIRVSTSPIQHV
ncbi:hypothetical protein ACP4OV_014987 [Aristida adscensionis]